MKEVELNILNVQRSIPIAQSYEGMLPSRLGYAT